MQVDFQSLMSGFSAPVDTGDPIKSIYGIIPYMDSTQMHLKFQLIQEPIRQRSYREDMG